MKIKGIVKIINKWNENGEDDDYQSQQSSDLPKPRLIQI